MSYSDLKLFALSSNKELAEKLRLQWGFNLGSLLYVSFQMVKFK
ncbi:ribose-phosphate pyrophosphokinase [Streptococcus dysgalactiae subsp. equisimilis]|nr:ribose-phosphate pyrophosphokinase [Streptococcus dysgalactiae subsp. equisimilis]